ncbi:lactococcin 972 family bacteriocin [Streptomyces sp. AM 2-1-1]|uniref:lactococcin 972 family bacteriocin n=1 Tax=Streptomyces sp. AM 2-1-1 TaxID=3028709 RepID=UPI0023B88605|nr:lactococcin 972 family bacteriocin [Streptomyces sp. AM 2-1-1]WEH38033.1 lactococcin 972 family bacteriocin [Streptomyces sp. AM 2-1-1]WEH43506.1 lactococcin 972 family bacteriocin [Streptomyces sp. AM 2-1-1]
MKKPGKFALAAVSLATAAGALAVAAPAHATAAPQVHVYSVANGDTPPDVLTLPNGDKPTEWGAVSFQEGSGPLTRASVGGGTWNYGTSAAATGKHCYSNYIHPSVKHSASVAMAQLTDKDIQNADVWAKAVVTAGVAYTCNAYWGKY